MFGVGVLALALALATDVAGFLGARYLAARWAGVTGGMVVFGLEHGPWQAVSGWRRLVFVLAGPAGWYVCSGLFLCLGTIAGGDVRFDEASMHVLVAPGTPAAEAGLMDRDRIVSVADVEPHDWSELKAAIGRHAGTEVPVVVDRGGATIVLHPSVSASGKIGVSPPELDDPPSFTQALKELVIGPAKLWASVLVRGARARAEPVEMAGPVAIVKAVGRAPRPRLGASLRIGGALSASNIWIPMVLALLLFPRSRRAQPAPPHA